MPKAYFLDLRKRAVSCILGDESPFGHGGSRG